ncbi:MAG: ATP-binding protein [Pseudomonadota bacterium]
MAESQSVQCDAFDPVLNRRFAIRAQPAIRIPQRHSGSGNFLTVLTMDDISKFKFPRHRNKRAAGKLEEWCPPGIENYTKMGMVQARLLAILEKTPSFVAMADHAGKLFYLNAAGRAMMKLGSGDDITGMSIFDCYAKGEWAALAEEAIPSAICGGVWSGSSVVRASDGREIETAQLIIAHHGCGGYLEGFSIIERDMTEWVKTEQALRLSRHELQRLSAQLLTIQESERQRIAGDLHDGIGQSLSMIKLAMEGAVKMMHDGACSEAMVAIQRVIPKVKEALVEVHRIAMDLRPSLIDDIGILATLSWFFREFEANCHNVKIEKHFSINESDVADALKISIYRIVQEAMSNIIKHANADRVQVSLKKIGDVLHLSIEDNGRGFDQREASKVTIRHGSDGGLGLLSMKERATLSGGTFAIESAVGQGTRVGVSWASV